MPVLTCKSCKGKFITDDKRCPHCGVWFSKIRLGGLSILLIIGFVMAVVAGVYGWNNPSDTNSSDCNSDWKQCKDNRDLINNYDGILQARSDCETVATNSAKYGEPKFHSSSFQIYFTGTNYVKTGIIFLEEDDAQFENIFGAMVHSTVVCKYDLNQKQVVDIEINQN